MSIELRQAAQQALKALEAISNEMTVGERYTNAGQYLLDALGPLRAALTQHPAKGEPVACANPDGLKSNWHAHHVIVNKAALQMVRNALRNDVERGLKVRGEMLAELDLATFQAHPAPSVPATPEPGVSRNPFASRCYTMSESHLSGHRLIVGFEKLGDAQDAHEWVARQGRGDFTHQEPELSKQLKNINSAMEDAQPVTGEPVQATPNFTQLMQILDGLNRCHSRDSKVEFLRSWIRDWTQHKVDKLTHPAPSAPATGEPVGYMNEGHIHELAMRRLPYGYVYPEAGAGASTAVYTHPAQSVPNLIEKAISSGHFGVLPMKASTLMCKAGWGASGGELTFQQIGHIYEEMYKARPLPDA